VLPVWRMPVVALSLALRSQAQRRIGSGSVSGNPRFSGGERPFLLGKSFFEY
jgi:hypothetical protein